ncbi:MAG: SMP-30/gluconolactonase/LRE family protein [Bacteroidota bacterium]
MIFTSNLICPEGPVALKDGSWLCVQGEPAGVVTHISADGKSHTVIAKTGRPNGLAVDKDECIWVAESRIPSLLKISKKGEEVILTGCGNEVFLFPNDLCFGSDGCLYMTDSGIFIDEFAPNGKIRDDYNDTMPDGRVYKINPVTKEISCIDKGIRFTNGIAFGKDNNLYANETLTGNIYKYSFNNGNIGNREFFGNVIDPAAAPGYKGPDGMAFDEDGLLYVTVFGQGDVTILDTNGAVVKRIKTKGKNPTNVAFANPPAKQIYVTEYEFGTIEIFDVETNGLALWS